LSTGSGSAGPEQRPAQWPTAVPLQPTACCTSGSEPARAGGSSGLQARSVSRFQLTECALVEFSARFPHAHAVGGPSRSRSRWQHAPTLALTLPLSSSCTLSADPRRPIVRGCGARIVPARAVAIAWRTPQLCQRGSPTILASLVYVLWAMHPYLGQRSSVPQQVKIRGRLLSVRTVVLMKVASQTFES